MNRIETLQYQLRQLDYDIEDLKERREKLLVLISEEMRKTNSALAVELDPHEEYLGI